MAFERAKKRVSSMRPERVPDKSILSRRRQSTLFNIPQEPADELRNLLWAAEFGDSPGIEIILNNHPQIDVNGMDSLGRTAIQIAVVNEHAEIVEMLLDRSNPINLYEALLLAVDHNHETITEMILKHPNYQDYVHRWPELAAQLPETSAFSDDISPIILACQKNFFGIVHLLWQEGMRIAPPHDFDCNCKRCAPGDANDAYYSKSRDQLKHAKRRLNEFRALTSEAYISLTSNDPFQTAFELSTQMEKYAAEEKHFKKEYKELSARLKKYVVKLLDNVRSHNELTTILNCHSVSESSVSPAKSDRHSSTPRQSTKTRLFSFNNNFHATCIKSEPLARLRVAILYKQKQFVAHWSCQQELMRQWLRGLGRHHLGSSDQTGIFLRLVFILLVYPVLLCFHWIAPKSKAGRLLSSPLVKFVSYSVSYLAFLAVLCLITTNDFGCYNEPERLSVMDDGPLCFVSAVYSYCPSLTENPKPTNFQFVENIGRLSASGVQEICSLKKDFVIRPRTENWMSWAVLIWLLGLFCRKLFEIFTRDIPNRLHQRWAAICRSPFDFIDYVVLAMFASAFTFRLLSYSMTTRSIDFFRITPPSNETLSEFPKHLYWLVADRCYFHPLDPLTCSEILFAIGAVFSFSRLLYIFPVFEVFGPCYLALMRVVNDIFAFFFVFFVVFAAFLIGTMNVYWYFNPNIRQTVQLNQSYAPKIPAEKRFGSLEQTFRTVFWSLFGLGESDYMLLVNFADGSMIWVERIGYIMYGAYNVVVVCVLLNMLIAMMANSYETIKINAEMEWKFARTILFLEYIPDYSPTAPTPFNLVPNPRYVASVFKRLYKIFRLEKRRRHVSFAGRTSYSRAKEHNAMLQMNGIGQHRPSIVITGEGRGSGDEEGSFSSESPFDQTLTVNSDDNNFSFHSLKFSDVIYKTVKRYVMALTFQGHSGTVDLEEIKQDISSFRFEVLDLLGNTSANDFKQRANKLAPTSNAITRALSSCSAKKAASKASLVDNQEYTFDYKLPSSPPGPVRRRTIVPYRRNHLLSSSLNRSATVVVDANQTQQHIKNSDSFRHRSGTDGLCASPRKQARRSGSDEIFTTSPSSIFMSSSAKLQHLNSIGIDENSENSSEVSIEVAL